MKTLLSMPATAEVTALGNKLFVCRKPEFTNLCVSSNGFLRRPPPHTHTHIHTLLPTHPHTHTPLPTHPHTHTCPPIHTYTPLSTHPHRHISLVLLSGVSGLLHQVHRADLSCASILHVSTSTRANRSCMTTREPKSRAFSVKLIFPDCAYTNDHDFYSRDTDNRTASSTHHLFFSQTFILFFRSL